MQKNEEPEYKEVRRALGDSFKRNGLVPIKATKENDYLVRIVVPRSAGEKKAGQAFNEIFHDLGILPAEISLSCGDWSNYCGFFLDEDSDAYFAMLNHPDAMQFKKGTEKYKLTLRGMFEAYMEEESTLVDEIKAGRLRSETPEGNLAVDDMLYMGIELADKTVVYRDFNAEELKRTLGITSNCLTREQASTANPQEQMRRAVDKVTLMDDSLNECDPFNVPEGFSPTMIAIHIGERIT